MSYGRMDLGGDQQKYKEKKDYVIDTTKKSELLKDENKTNGYNIVVEPLVMHQANTKKMDKKDLSVQKGKTASDQIKSMVRSQEMFIGEEGIRNLNELSGSITSITSMLSEEMPMPQKDVKTNKVTKDSIEKCREKMDVSCVTISLMYDRIIGNLDKCLENANGETDDEGFKYLLTELKKQCEEERDSFKDRSLHYQSLFIKDPKRKGETPTWADALEFSRGEYYDLDSPDYEIIQTFGTKEKDDGKIRIRDKKKGKTLVFSKNIIASSSGQELDEEKLAYARIERGSSMSGRQVATTRMAELLDVPDIVSASKTAFMKQGDSLIKGCVTEETGGLSARQIALEGGDLSFGMESLSQLFMLQGLDAINGHVDRNEDNIYYLHDDSGLITGIKATENLMSHGNTTFKDMCTAGYLGVKPMNSLVISSLPTKFINKVFNIQRPVLDLIFADVLSKSEIDAMWERISAFQNLIANCFKYDMEYREEMVKRDGFYKDVYLGYKGKLSDDNYRMKKSMEKMADRDWLKYTNIPGCLAPSNSAISQSARDNRAQSIPCPEVEERRSIINADPDDAQ